MRYGIDAKPFDWSDEITVECPRRHSGNLYDQCGARCPDLSKVVRCAAMHDGILEYRIGHHGDGRPVPLLVASVWPMFVWYTYGHTVKITEMPQIMRHRRAEDWGQTKWRYVHGFHLHQSARQSLPQRLFVFQSLQPSEATWL
jgi:hypothetical protein